MRAERTGSYVSTQDRLTTQQMGLFQQPASQPGARRTSLQPRFGQIDVPLDPPQDLVVDHVFVPQLQDHGAFHLQDLAGQLFVEDVECLRVAKPFLDFLLDPPRDRPLECFSLSW